MKTTDKTTEIAAANSNTKANRWVAMSDEQIVDAMAINTDKQSKADTALFWNLIEATKIKRGRDARIASINEVAKKRYEDGKILKGQYAQIKRYLKAVNGYWTYQGFKGKVNTGLCTFDNAMLIATLGNQFTKLPDMVTFQDEEVASGDYIRAVIGEVNKVYVKGISAFNYNYTLANVITSKITEATKLTPVDDVTMENAIRAFSRWSEEVQKGIFEDTLNKMSLSEVIESLEVPATLQKELKATVKDFLEAQTKAA